VVDGEKPGVDSRDEGKHTGRNDLLFADNMMWMDELAGVMGYIRLYQGSILALMLPGRPLCVGGVYGRSSPVSLCSLLLVPWTRTSTGQRSFAGYGSRTWNRLPTALRSPELSLGSFKRQLKTHSSVPALDSAGCSCECCVPSSHRRCCDCRLQRVRRRLQMSRPDSTRPQQPI